MGAYGGDYVTLLPKMRGRERVCLTNASLCLLGGCSGSSGRRMQPARPSTQGLFGRGWADLAIGRVTQGGGGAVGVVGGGPPLVGTSTRCHHGGARAGAWGRTLGWCWFLGRDLSGRGLAYHARRPPCTTSHGEGPADPWFAPSSTKGKNKNYPSATLTKS